MNRSIVFLLLLVCGSAFAQSLSENFDSGLPTTAVSHAPPGAELTLTSGAWWALNSSVPLGTAGVFQGGDTVFPAFNGAPTAYAGMNFNSTTGAGTINTWLMSPQRTFTNGDTITFYTRKNTPAPIDYPDRVYLKLSQNGASTTPADFSTILVAVNPSLVAGGYPVVWTQFTATISGMAAPSSGRFAFNYSVTDGGPSGSNSDYIGIDAVVYTQLPVDPVFLDGFEN